MIGHYQVTTGFKCRDGTIAPGPYLLPIDYDANSTAFAAPLTLYVPYVAGPVTSPPIAGNPDFSLAWIPFTNAGVVESWVQINIQPLNVFVADHSTLLNSFHSFRVQLEALEDRQSLLPGGAAVLCNRIASGLPLRFDELLPFFFGFDSKSRTVDLSPGMELWVHHGSYQYVAPPSRPGGDRNAYGGVGLSRWRARRRRDGKLGFDPFLDGLAGFQIARPDPPQIGGLLDVEAAGAAFRYQRLVHPPQLDNAASIQSAPSAAGNATLIGADARADLDAATQQYLQGAPPTGPAVRVFFSGRAAVVPHVTINVNGQDVSVPLGTTLRDVVANSFVVTSDDLNPRANQLNLTLWRWGRPLLGDPRKRGGTSFAAASVQFEAASPLSPTTGLTQWDLPLGIGDTIAWAPPARGS